MKSHLVSIFGITGFAYAIPESIAELASKAVPIPDGTNDEDKAKLVAKGEARVLHAATQHLLQRSLANVRVKAIELIGQKYSIKPKLTVGKVEVVPVVYTKGEKGEDGKVIDKEGVIKCYANAADPKKTFKKDVKNLKTEGDTEFFARFKEEKGFTDESPEVKAIVQEAADAVPFSAEQKRVRGSVASKPIGKSWVKLAEGIIKANNHDSAAERLSKQIGKPVDVSDPTTRVTILALALQEKARQSKAAEEADLKTLAGSANTSEQQEQGEDEAPTVVDGTKEA